MNAMFVILAILVLLFFSGDLFAVARNPPPEFESAYKLPPIPAPEPFFPVTQENIVLLGLYGIFLITAGLAVHYWRSRKILFILAVFSVGLFGFFWQGCLCPVGTFQNLVLAAIDPRSVVSWTVVLLFLLPLLAALFWGRIFCSAVCPLGAIQELTTLKNRRIPDQIEHILGLFRYFWLGIGVFCVSVGLGFVICQWDPYIALFQRSGVLSVLIFGAVMLVFGFIVGRPFCRFLCPYGALLGICSSFSARKTSITPGQCDQCRLCEHVCPYNAILPPMPAPALLERRTGPTKLAIACLSLPIIVLLFGYLAGATAPRLATLHRNIQTAELLHIEEEKWVETSGTFPETRGLIQIGKTSDAVYQEALQTYRLFQRAGFGLGIWIGLVIGIKWITLSLRRPRKEYEVDPARCFSCGRCFWYCPNQKEQRLLLIKTEKPEEIQTQS